MGVGRPVRFITLLNYCSDSSRQLINGHQGMPEPRHVCVGGARPRPRRAARLRPRLPRVQRILPPHARPLLRPVHLRALPPGRREAETAVSAPQPRRSRKKSHHNRQRSQCQDCGGASICQHNRIRSRCNDFGGASICQHNRQRGQCKDCGGTSICEHNSQIMMMMSFVNFETMRRRRVLWRRGGAPVGCAASGHGLPDAGGFVGKM